MSKKSLLLILSLLLFTGQGCLSFGSNTAPDGGLFATQNLGSEWTRLNQVLGSNGVGSLQSQNILELELDPSDPSTMYMGTREGGLVYTIDNGASWLQPEDPKLRAGAISDIEVSPSDVCTVYVAKGPRLYKTDNCLRTFDDETFVETRPGVYIRDIEVDWFNPSIVWLGLSNGEVLKSDMGGGRWKTVLTENRRMVTAMMVSNIDSRIVLVGTQTDGFYRTNDGGETWEHIKTDLKGRTASILYLTQDESGEHVFASTKAGIMKSRDTGNTWEDLTLLTAAGQVTINAVSVYPKNPDQIRYAAGNTFYSSEDGGNTWSTRAIPTSRRPQTMRIDPRDSSVLYVGVISVE